MSCVALSAILLMVLLSCFLGLAGCRVCVGFWKGSLDVSLAIAGFQLINVEHWMCLQLLVHAGISADQCRILVVSSASVGSGVIGSFSRSGFRAGLKAWYIALSLNSRMISTRLRRWFQAVSAAS